MRKRILELVTIPPEIKQEFQQDCLRKNRLSIFVLSILIFCTELFNIIRVLFWSKSGLDSVNNCIYLGMYCSLLFAAVLYLLLQHFLRKASFRAQWTIQCASVAFVLLWNVGLNTYDLIRNPTAEAYPYITVIVGIAMFIQMFYAMSAAYLGLGYALFMFLNFSVLEVGAIINLTITTAVALTISFIRCHHAVIDLSQRREISQMNDQLQKLLRKDPLTGLLNKKASEECITGSLRTDALTLYMVDLDDFKAVNDQYGHPCGDYVLEETARTLQTIFPDAVCVGRTGGDEFIVLQQGVDDLSRLEQKGDQLIRTLSEIRWQGQKIGLTCSIGILPVRQPGACYEQVYAEADRALYDAKRRGKGRCWVQEAF